MLGVNFPRSIWWSTTIFFSTEAHFFLHQYNFINQLKEAYFVLDTDRLPALLSFVQTVGLSDKIQSSNTGANNQQIFSAI